MIPTTEMRTLAETLGWDVRRDSLLVQAMSHSSWCHGTQRQSNERLEFLGDAVMELAVTNYLFSRFELVEGNMAKIRAAVVNTITLAEVARELNVGDAILLGRGEAAGGGREKTKILADALEATFGAIYLDRGQAVASSIILSLLGDRIEAEAAGPGQSDYKTRLQEICAQLFPGQVVRYDTTETGPDHARTFIAHVFVGGVERGNGTARSKKQAEHASARLACSSMGAR